MKNKHHHNILLHLNILAIGVVFMIMLFSLSFWGEEGLFFGSAFSVLTFSSLLFMSILHVFWTRTDWTRYQHLPYLQKFNFLLVNIFIFLLFISGSFFYRFLEIGNNGLGNILFLVADLVPWAILISVMIFIFNKFLSKQKRDIAYCCMLIIGDIVTLFWLYIILVMSYADVFAWQNGAL